MSAPHLPPTLVLDRHHPPRWERSRLTSHSPVPRPARRPAVPCEAPAGRRATARPSLRDPGLVLLAGIAVLEGYRRLGVIPIGRAGLSAAASSRLATALVAGLLAGGVLALVHLGATRLPSTSRVTMSVAASVVVVASATLLIVGGRPASDVLGIAYLLLAATSIGAIAADGLRRRRAAPHHPAESLRLG